MPDAAKQTEKKHVCWGSKGGRGIPLRQAPVGLEHVQKLLKRKLWIPDELVEH